MYKMRITSELNKCSKLDNFNITLHDDNLLEWLIEFKPDTPVFKGTYNIKLTIPTTYPFSAPNIRFMSYIFHPSIDRTGKMCLSMLDEWHAAYNISMILLAIQSEFCEPTLSNPLNAEAASLWSSNIEEYKKRLR